MCFTQRPVPSVLQGSVLEPVRFNFFVSGLEEALVCRLMKFPKQKHRGAYKRRKRNASPAAGKEAPPVSWGLPGRGAALLTSAWGARWQQAGHEPAALFSCCSGDSVQFWAHQTGKMLINWSKFRRGPPRWLGLEHFCKEMLRKWDLFCLKMRRLWRHLTAAQCCLGGGYEEHRTSSQQWVVRGQEAMGINWNTRGSAWQ